MRERQGVVRPEGGLEGEGARQDRRIDAHKELQHQDHVEGRPRLSNGSDGMCIVNSLST